MPTAIEHMRAGLGLIGQDSIIMPAPPDILARCRVVLNSMIARWVNNGIEIEVIPAPVPGDEVYNDDWATPAIQYNLAVMMAPECRVACPPEVTKMAGDLYAEMLERTRLLRVSPNRSVPDGRLPVGSGNDRGGAYITRFYGPRGQ
jgi:hypothetical protein